VFCQPYLCQKHLVAVNADGMTKEGLRAALQSGLDDKEAGIQELLQHLPLFRRVISDK